MKLHEIIKELFTIFLNNEIENEFICCQFNRFRIEKEYETVISIMDCFMEDLSKAHKEHINNLDYDEATTSTEVSVLKIDFLCLLSLMTEKELRELLK